MVRKVYLVGIGLGDPATMTGQAQAAIAESGLLIGAARMLEPYRDRACEKAALIKTADIVEALRESDADVASVLFSGDVGFYSGATALARALEAVAADRADDFDIVAVPGISSLVYFCARALVPWQDAHLVSAHGRACDPVAEVRSHAKTFFLTGGKRGARDICAELVAAGLGDVRVQVGERLSYDDERISCGTASELAGEEFDTLAVMLVENPHVPKREPGALEEGGSAPGADAAPAPGADAASTPASASTPDPDALGPRLLISAPASGGGKTTFTCGLMQALVKRGLAVQACKCGPDYIDPMFHREVIGAASRNLDLFFMSESQVRALVEEGARESDITVIEGVMGYYDGIAVSDVASAWDVARTTETPVVLVVDGRGRARSIAAEVLGFMRLREPSLIAGVVVNRCSPALYPRLAELIETECGVRALGYVPTLADCSLESRHLGLVTAAEVEGLREKLDRIAAVLEDTVDIDGLLELAHHVKRPHRLASCQTTASFNMISPAPVIAVARDDAFCFYYDDTLALFERLGARIVEFSPLSDRALPQGTCGLYLGGGYPELHGEELSANASLLAEIRGTIAAGMPTIAECGGFMYLHERLEDDSGTIWPMVGAIAGTSFKTDRLGRFGYIGITAKSDNLLCAAGETLPAHEFHYWDSEDPGASFHAQKPQSARGWECAHASDSLYAGYPHLCLHGVPHAAERFVAACARWAASAETGEETL